MIFRAALCHVNPAPTHPPVWADFPPHLHSESCSVRGAATVSEHLARPSALRHNPLHSYPVHPRGREGGREGGGGDIPLKQHHCSRLTATSLHWPPRAVMSESCHQTGGFLRGQQSTRQGRAAFTGSGPRTRKCPGSKPLWPLRAAKKEGGGGGGCC